MWPSKSVMATLNFDYGNLFLKSLVQASQCPGK